jgi:hypothetical protein
MGWVEKLPVPWRQAAARPTMQEHDRLPCGVAAFLPVEGMEVVNRQKTGPIRIDRREKRRPISGGAGWQWHASIRCKCHGL